MKFLLKHDFTDAIVPRHGQGAVFTHTLRLYVRGTAELPVEETVEAVESEAAEYINEGTVTEVKPQKTSDIFRVAVSTIQNLQYLAFG